MRCVEQYQIQEVIFLAPISPPHIYKHKAGQKFSSLATPGSGATIPIAQALVHRGGDMNAPCPSSSHSMCGQGFSTKLANTQEQWSQGDLREQGPPWDPLSPPAKLFAMMPLEVTLGLVPCTGYPGKVLLLWPLPAAPVLLCSMAVVAWLHLPAGCTGKAGRKAFPLIFLSYCIPPPWDEKNISLYWHIMCFEKTGGAMLQEVS